MTLAHANSATVSRAAVWVTIVIDGRRFDIGPLSAQAAAAINYQGTAEPPCPEVRESLPDLLLGIHDEGSVGDHGFVDRIGMSEKDICIAQSFDDKQVTRVQLDQPECGGPLPRNTNLTAHDVKKHIAATQAVELCATTGPQLQRTHEDTRQGADRPLLAVPKPGNEVDHNLSSVFENDGNTVVLQPDIARRLHLEPGRQVDP